MLGRFDYCDAAFNIEDCLGITRDRSDHLVEFTHGGAPLAAPEPEKKL